MRVGLLIYGSLETLSGGYLYDRKLVDHLRRQGDQVEIVSLPWRGYPLLLLDNFSISLRKKLQALKVDVLIQDELNHPSLAWLNQKLEAPYPVVALVHHLRCQEIRPVWQNRFYRWVERNYLQGVDSFIFNSETTRRSVSGLSRIQSRPWVIANPAGDRFDQRLGTTQIVKRAHQPGPLHLVFLGNIIPRKGLHTLLQALDLLPRESFVLDVVGDHRVNWAYGRYIHHLVARLDLNDTVHFHAALPDEALAALLERSQVLAVPSSYEGFGIVYLEGMSFGLPAIGTRQGAAGEIILPGKCGYLIQAGDSASLAEILQNLHHDREKLAELGIAASKRYRQFPGWEQSMEKVREFLAGILSNAQL